MKSPHDGSMKSAQDNPDAIELDPAYFLQSGRKKSARPVTTLIILNSTIHDFEAFRQLYQHADSVICADGGANRLYDLLTEKYSDYAFDVALKKYPPSAIHGDLDSIDEHVRQAYTAIGVPVTLDTDQYSTDFQKALKKAGELTTHLTDVLVLGSVGGRVDQGIGLLHEFHREQCDRRPDLRFWLFSEVSVSTILLRGSSTLRTPLKEGILDRCVGLLPIYGPASLTTRGLEWDVESWHSSMGGNVSTSNHIVKDAIEVDTDHEILFTVELRGPRI